LLALIAVCAGFLGVFQYRRTVYDPTFGLLRQVRYADRAGREAAIRSLQEMADTSPAVVETLLDAVGDADAAVRAAAVGVVANIANERLRVVGQKKQADPYAGAVEAALRASLKDRDSIVCLRAASGLSLLGVKSEDCFTILMRAAQPNGEPARRFLRGGEPDDRFCGLWDLAHVYRDRPETRAVILKAIADRDTRARRQGLTALHWLLRLGDSSGADAQPVYQVLFDCLVDEDDSVSNLAAHILSYYDPKVAPRAVALLVRKLSSPDRSTRAGAAYALREFELYAEAALPALRALADSPGDPSHDVEAARKAVAAIEKACRTFDEETLPNLIANLSHEDPDVRAGAASAVAEFGPRAKAAIPHLSRTLNDPEQKVRRRASVALEALGATRTGPTRE
jgi:HEAT repeat protein